MSLNVLRPTGGFFGWASGPSGSGNITLPTQAQRNLGWQANTAPPAAYFNAKFNSDFQWQAYLDDRITRLNYDTVLREDFIATGMTNLGASMISYDWGPWEVTTSGFDKTNVGAIESIGIIRILGNSGLTDYIRTPNNVILGDKPFSFEAIVRPASKGLSGSAIKIGLSNIGFLVNPSGNWQAYYCPTGTAGVNADLTYDLGASCPTGTSGYNRLTMECSATGGTFLFSVDGSSPYALSKFQSFNNLANQRVQVQLTNVNGSIQCLVDMISLSVDRGRR